MPDGEQNITINVCTKISDISENDWNSCAGNTNPFICHAFLHALEKSGSVTEKTGWLPQHVVIYDENKRAIACMPVYLKNHSYGEYIFDWGWAEAFNKAGGRYYPKLQSAVPFTPATGPRMLLRKGVDPRYYDVLMTAIIELSRRHGVSSLHITFPTEIEWKKLGKAGFIQRTSKQFHWENKNYHNFGEFLAQLSSRKRKAIKKERRIVQEQGIKLTRVIGKDLTESHWDSFYDFYIDTTERKWGRSYLTREFFSILGETMSDLAMLVVAEYGGKRIAGALNLIGSDTIFGRNWGCLNDFRFLHFEACYYQAIEFAIENKLRWVEAGAQGPHKIQRGYLPKEVYSAHWIDDPRFRQAVLDFVEQERKEIEFEINGLMKYSPYRNC